MIVPVPLSAVAATAAASSASTTPARDPKIREAAEGFEGIFMSILVEEMMKGSSVAEGNPVYAGLLNQKLGDQLARSGGIGLADMLERQMGGTPTTTGGLT